MDHSHTADHAAPVDPQALQDARKTWSGFTHMIRYGIIGVAVILLLMAVFVA